MNAQANPERQITAIKVRQWLNSWNEVVWDEANHRREPEHYFYIFTLSATELKALSGIYRRTTEGRTLQSQDLSIQRRHDKRRSDTIQLYVQHGYPWSELSENKRISRQFNDLRKPGWLPTSIVINILTEYDKRHNITIAEEDRIKITDRDSSVATMQFPSSFTGIDWNPSTIYPIEVIDGQHRLWAFEDFAFEGDFEVPVVAFYGLDISWQAYLFWTINISPVKINRSLAFDLYPLLRMEDWLEKFEGHPIYREARAQELVETLWGHPESPWYHAINMLGEPGLEKPMASQAAWIRSLMATYVKAWESPRSSIGGLFGARVGQDNLVLPWSRAQQASFLIIVGKAVQGAIKDCTETWAEKLRNGKQLSLTEIEEKDPAFSGEGSLLATDQGIRGLLYVTNDLCFQAADTLKLHEWEFNDNEAEIADEENDNEAKTTDEKVMSKALQMLQDQPVYEFINQIAQCLATYDWRTSSADLSDLSDDEKTLKAVFRGSGGYKELRRQLLLHMMRCADAALVSETAKFVYQALRYD